MISDPIVDPSDQLLVFRLTRGQYALRLPSVAAVSEPGIFRRVPLAPDSVLGLTEARGRAVTVLDLTRLLEEEPGDGMPSVVYLAEPFEHLALFVPAAVELRRPEPVGEADDPFSAAIEDHAGTPELLDPSELVSRIEGELGIRQPAVAASD